MTAVTEIASIKRRFCAHLIDVAISTLLIVLLLEDSPLILDVWSQSVMVWRSSDKRSCNSLAASSLPQHVTQLSV